MKREDIKPGVYALMQIDRTDPASGLDFEAVDLIRIESVEGDVVTLYVLTDGSTQTDQASEMLDDYHMVPDELAGMILAAMRTYAHERFTAAARSVAIELQD